MRYEELLLLRDNEIRERYGSYSSLSAKEIWQKFVDADEYIMTYLYGRKYTGSKAAFPTSNNNDASKFHHYNEDSMLFIWLLREKEKWEIQSLCNSIEDKTYIDLIHKDIMPYVKAREFGFEL